MNFVKPMSNLYQLYSMGKMPIKDFISALFQYLHRNCSRYKIFSQDNWDEFLSWMYPRLVRAIEIYREKDSSFDAYLNSLIQSSSKEYRRREAEHYFTEYACWQAKIEDMHLSEEEPEYLNDQNVVSIPEGITPRQILFLLLKSYFFASDDFVEYIARAIGMESKFIWHMIDELHTLCSEKEEKIFSLRERLHCQYYRCRAYQKRMNNTQVGTGYYRILNERLERAKKRYYSMKKRLGGMRMGAANRLISMVTGVPKGTVDSSLSLLKRTRAA